MQISWKAWIYQITSQMIFEIIFLHQRYFPPKSTSYIVGDLYIDTPSTTDNAYKLILAVAALNDEDWRSSRPEMTISTLSWNCMRILKQISWSRAEIEIRWWWESRERSWLHIDSLRQVDRTHTHLQYHSTSTIIARAHCLLMKDVW